MPETGTRHVYKWADPPCASKANIVLNMVVTMFSQHCDVPFTVEPVDVVDALGKVTTTPDLANRQLSVGIEYVNRCTGMRTPRDS